MASLIIKRPGHPDESVALGDTEITVGRQAGNELVIDDQSMSRKHAVISATEEGHTVRDLGSRNGTWLNGNRITEKPQLLRHGDEVRLGRHALTLRYLTEEATVPEGLTLSSYMPGSTAFNISWPGSSRSVKLLKMTPWVRLVSAVLGGIAALIGIVVWIIRLAG